jgi:hypothetical protein
MLKRTPPRTPRTLKAARWLAAPAAALALFGCPDEDLAPLEPCTVSGVSAEVPVSGVDKVDLLFMIDNSGSMAQEQAKLAEQLPKLVDILTSGVREDKTTFSPVRDLHVGIVTSDMGLNGSDISLTSCDGFGDDGKLLKTSKTKSCSTNAPAGYLGYSPGGSGSSLEDVKSDFTCLADVGTEGCGFEQQLESVYKAVAPPSVKFAGNRGGNADGANKGFLRPDAVLAIVHVSDEEDCSVTNEGMVLFDENTSSKDVKLPGSTTKNLGLNIRCAFGNPDERETQVEKAGLIHPVKRYYEDFIKNVKPLNAERIVFAAIVGIPDGTDGSTPAGLEEILKHEKMGFHVDENTGTPKGDPSNRNTAAKAACVRLDNANNEITNAKPAVRFVKVAQGFGENGVIQSICADSFAPAVNTIIDKISKQLTGACLPRSLNPNSDGLVDCDVVEILGPSGTPEKCSAKRGRKFKEMRNVNGESRVVCDINQIAIGDDNSMLGESPKTLEGVDPKIGWYYDDFSTQVTEECPADKRRRISFSPEEAEPQDATLRFECFQPVVSSDDQAVGKAAVNTPCIEDKDCSDRKGQDPYVLFCESETTNTCQVRCVQDSECPPSWVCESQAMVCINPTCPPPSAR